MLNRGRVSVDDSASGVGGGIDQEVTRVVGNGRPFRRSVDGKFGVEGMKLLGLGRLTFEVDGLNVIGDISVGDGSRECVTIMGGGAANVMEGVLTGDTCPLLNMSSSSFMFTMAAGFFLRLLNLASLSVNHMCFCGL